jgi:hypothetical protein
MHGKRRSVLSMRLFGASTSVLAGAYQRSLRGSFGRKGIRGGLQEELATKKHLISSVSH